MRGPWNAWRTNQSTLKEIDPEYSLEGLMLKLKLQYFGYWERLNTGGEGNNRRIRWLGGITDSMDMNLSKLRETVKNREDWHAVVHGVAKSRIHLRD